MASRAEVRRRGAGPVALYAAASVVFGVFLFSTIPGVRPRAGYDLFLDGCLNNVAYALSAVVCLVRGARAGGHRRSWRWLGSGLALYGAGNVYWTIAIRPQDPEPFPSLADALWLSFYPCAFVALLLVMREVADNVPVSLWLDGVVGGLAVAGVAAAVFDPILAVTGGSRAAVITTLAYPLLDVLLLLVVTALVAVFHWRPPVSLWLLASGLAMFAVADAAYLFSAGNGTYQPGGAVDAVWVTATLVIGFAPSRSQRGAGVALPEWVRLGFPVAATLCALTVLVYDHRRPLNLLAVALCAATVVAALVRLVATFREAKALAGSHLLARTDELTALGNRRSLYDTVHRRLAGPDLRGALLLLDLDRFKEVNDSLGHQAGDGLLREVAARLTSRVHPRCEALSRLGGDEFALLLVGVERAEAEQLASDIRDVLEPPFSVDGVTVRVSASIGISLFPDHGQEVSTLLRRADIAMYQAKALRAGSCVYSAASDDLHGSERLRNLEELRTAIADRSLVLHFQPKVDVRTLEVAGVEALVRWRHPERGLLYPDAFLPLVEDAGLMGELTDAVLEQALEQLRVWRDAGRDLAVAVNLSASSLVDDALPLRIWTALQERRLPAHVLELEITEDFLMGDRERARVILADLRRLGIRVAVDDFGTGYSSLAYLRELPIDELKLDRSFVLPMGEDPRAEAIVRSTIDLAHALGMTMVAEGVEDGLTADRLASSSCDKIQGFFYSRALPAAELEHWLDSRGGDASASDSTALTGAIR